MYWLIILTTFASLAKPDQAAVEYRLVVNDSTVAEGLRVTDVARIFLKRKRQWNDGKPIRPVDQSVASPTRSAFSRAVLDMSLGEVRDHWMKTLLSGGDVPPPVRAGDADVIEFVRTQPGAIGYVSSDTEIPIGVRALDVR